MRFLTSKELSPATQAYLERIQAEINDAPTFPARVTAAQTAWRNQTQNLAFREIRQALLNLCLGIEICHYCESNEATDIEHVKPKSFFPEWSFVWENYLLVCKTCNSHYKLDRVAVFWPTQPCSRYDVPRGTAPPNAEVLMINPRTEDPFEYWQLNLRTGVLLEAHPVESCPYQRAAYTLEVLNLNDRDVLREAREKAARERFRDLRYAVQIYETTSYEGLDQIVNANEPFVALDRSHPLWQTKQNLLSNIRQAIRHKPHYSVWLAIKKQHSYYPKFKDLFARLPEALEW